MIKEILVLIIDGVAVVFLLLWSIVFFALILQYFLNILGGKYAIPFLPTPVKMVDMMLDLGKIKDDDKIIDLGSGIGTIVIRAAQKFKVEATGVEINLFLHIIGSIINIFTPKKGNANLKWGSMFNEDLSQYNVIMIFLTSSFINKYLKEKLEKEVRKGTKIISYTFTIDTEKFTIEEFPTGRKGLGKQIYIYTKK
jgi:hypothetical protein